MYWTRLRLLFLEGVRAVHLKVLACVCKLTYISVSVTCAWKKNPMCGGSWVIEMGFPWLMMVSSLGGGVPMFLVSFALSAVSWTTCRQRCLRLSSSATQRACPPSVHWILPRSFCAIPPWTMSAATWRTWSRTFLMTRSSACVDLVVCNLMIIAWFLPQINLIFGYICYNPHLTHVFFLCQNAVFFCLFGQFHACTVSG